MRIGEEIAGYRLEGLIGEGGMGVVYRATQASLDRVVAVKLLSDELSRDERFRRRFRREATLQASIEHPNIVPVYEASESDRGLYIAMRLVPGPDLKTVIREGELTPQRAIALLTGVANALDTAHRHGVIHCDVKPANILVVGDHAYLADFGLTRAVGRESITKSGPVFGTLDYIAPEQIRGEEPDPRSDIYSLAAVLYECLTGAVPFRRETEVAVIYAHLEQQPASVQDIRPDLPVELDAVIRRAMAKAPRDRHPTARGLIEDAAAALAQGPLSSATAALVDSPRAARRRPAARTPTTSPALDAQSRRTASVGAPGRAPRALGLAGAVVIALAAGTLAGHSGAVAAGPPLTQALSVAGASVYVPRSWHPPPSGEPPIQYLFLHDSSSYVPPGVAGAGPGNGAEAGVLVGRVGALGPDLLPQSIHRYATFTSRPGIAVRLHGLQAMFYGGVASRDGRRRIQLFLFPTTQKVVGVACYGPMTGAQVAALARCGEVAATLRVSSGTLFALGPRKAYAALLERSLNRLGTLLGTRLHALKAAHTSGEQAAAGKSLAAAYASAALSLSRLEVGTLSPAEVGIHFSIRDALREVSRAYGSLASAASLRDPAGFGAAENRIRSTVNLLHASLDELKTLGYATS